MPASVIAPSSREEKEIFARAVAAVCTTAEEHKRLRAWLDEKIAGLMELEDAPSTEVGQRSDESVLIDLLEAFDAVDEDETGIAPRLDLRLTPLVADASALPETLLARPFDAILADVPCSATGVMRRNPDIKILREFDDIAGFANQQLAILTGLWPALKPGGRLLYVTCSLLAAENDEVVSRFAARHSAHIDAVTLDTGTPRQHGWQTLPNRRGGDGLYFALLRKPAE